MLERLLSPVDDELNQHKQNQLIELAKINGASLTLQLDCMHVSPALCVWRLPDSLRLDLEACCSMASRPLRLSRLPACLFAMLVAGTTLSVYTGSQHSLADSQQFLQERCAMMSTGR